MREILLLGGGGHCKSVIDVIEQEAKYKIAGIIDVKERVGERLLGYEIIGCNEDLKQLRQRFSYAMVTVGQMQSNQARIKLFKLLEELEFETPVIISPLAYVSKHAFIDVGSVVMHHALINAHAKVGKNCIINSKALIEHDARVEDFSHVSTGAILNGGATLKENSFFSSAAVMRENGEAEGFVKMGSLVKQKAP